MPPWFVDDVDRRHAHQQQCRMIARLGSCGVLIVLGFAARPSHAAELATPVGPEPVQVHGFVSQGFIKSTGNDYLASSKRGSFEFSEIGINFTTQLTDKLRFGVQLFAHDLGPIGNYSAKADWYYLDYRWRDWLGFRAGRLKVPFGLYNETSDIDAARPTILLPTSVYPPTNRDYFLAQTGFEFYGFQPLRRLGAIDYRLYGGTIFIDLPNQRGAPVQIGTLSIPYVGGGRVMWETPIEGLRVGGSFQALKLESTILFSAPTAASAGLDIKAYLGLGSIEYAARDLLLAAEYGRYRLYYRTTDPVLFPVPPGAVVNEQSYVMAAYRVRRWLQPAAYYAFSFPDESKRHGRENMLLDGAATLRFDVNQFWIVKVEAHYMHGTAGLPNAPIAPADWALFLIKTTVYF
jgi:hypothetical protein